MLFKLNLTFLCGMCIFPIFISGISLIGVFKQTPAIDAADFSSADQISEMLYKKITLNDSKIETKNSENQLCDSVLSTLENPKGIETFRSTMSEVLNQISDQNNDVQRIIIRNIFIAMNSRMKQNVAENNVRSFWDELKNHDEVLPTETRIIRKTALDDNASGKLDGLINFKEDISVDMRQENTSNERNSILEHWYNSRDLDDDTEDYTDVPAFGFTWRKPDAFKQKKHAKEYEHDASERDSTKLVKSKPKPKTKIHGGRKSYSFDDLIDLGTPTKPISDENFGNKIFLFKDNNDSGASPLSSAKKDDKGENSLFLFDNELPDPSEKLDSNNLFYQ